jgi:hypothetical protein
MNPTSIALVLLLSAVAAFSQPAKATLLPAVKEALIDALAGEDGEYAARAKYAAIVAKFGQVQPYAYLRNAENYQSLALEGQLRKAGVVPPSDRFTGKASTPASLPEAAAEAIRLEERTVACYERLLRTVNGDSDLTRIVQNLQRMTREGHLASVKAAAENGGSLTAEQIRARIWQRRPASSN